MTLILASKNNEILRKILNHIYLLPRVIEEKKLNRKVNFHIEEGSIYNYLMGDCEKNLLEYIRGFCCGYMLGKDFDNSE